MAQGHAVGVVLDERGSVGGTDGSDNSKASALDGLEPCVLPVSLGSFDGARQKRLHSDGILCIRCHRHWNDVGRRSCKRYTEHLCANPWLSSRQGTAHIVRISVV